MGAIERRCEGSCERDGRSDLRTPEWEVLSDPSGAKAPEDSRLSGSRFRQAALRGGLGEASAAITHARTASGWVHADVGRPELNEPLLRSPVLFCVSVTIL